MEVERLRIDANAPIILADDYTIASALPFYLPSQVPVAQISERIRWINEPQPSAALFAGPMLYVCRDACDRVPMLPPRFRGIQHLSTMWRMRNGVRVERVEVFRLTGPIGSPLNPVYPIRVKGVDYDTL